MQKVRLQIAMYYFGIMATLSGGALLFLFSNLPALCFTAFVCTVSALVFVVLAKKVDKMNAEENKPAPPAPKEEPKREISTTRIAEYGGQHVMISGNYYMTLRNTLILALALFVGSCTTPAEKLPAYTHGEVIAPSYACPETLRVTNPEGLTAAMQLVADGKIDATDYAIDSILHNNCLDSLDYANKY